MYSVMYLSKMRAVFDENAKTEIYHTEADLFSAALTHVRLRCLSLCITDLGRDNGWWIKQSSPWGLRPYCIEQDRSSIIHVHVLLTAKSRYSLSQCAEYNAISNTSRR